MADNRLYIQAQKFKLSNGIALADTSIALESFNLPNGTAIASGDLGAVNYATLEPGTSNEEQISFTGFSGTTLSGVTRGLDFSAPYTAVSGNRKAHAAGAILVISNTSAFYNDFVNKANDETIAGTHTFTSTALPTLDSYAAPTADAQLAAKKYVDDVAAGGSATTDRHVIAGTAGETIAAGEIVYFDATAKEWKLADASVTGTADNIILGVAQGAGTDGVAISGGVLLAGLDTNQTGMTAGTKQFLSDTAGALSESTGTVEVSLGYSNSGSTTDLIFAPRFDQQITEDIQDALGGTSGTPSNSNKYVTADDVATDGTADKIVRLSTTTYPAGDGSALTNLTVTPPTQMQESFTTGALCPAIAAGELVWLHTDGFVYPYTHLGQDNFIVGFADAGVAAKAQSITVNTWGIDDNQTGLTVAGLYRALATGTSASISQTSTATGNTDNNGQYLWQSFTVGGADIEVVSVTLYFVGGAGGGANHTVRVREGEGEGGTLIGVGTGNSPSTPATITIPLDHPIVLTASTQYSINSYTDAVANWGYDGTNPLAGGRAEIGAGDDYAFAINVADGSGMGRIATSGSLPVVGLAKSATELLIRQQSY